MFPKLRLDALHDGIFSVAMTLLVLDVRLPEDFHPHNAAELTSAIGNLWPKVLPSCVPCSNIVGGRYGSVAPAVWLYAGHLLLIALVNTPMMALTPDLEPS